MISAETFYEYGGVLINTIESPYGAEGRLVGGDNIHFLLGILQFLQDTGRGIWPGSDTDLLGFGHDVGAGRSEQCWLEVDLSECWWRVLSEPQVEVSLPHGVEMVVRNRPLPADPLDQSSLWFLPSLDQGAAELYFLFDLVQCCHRRPQAQH